VPIYRGAPGGGDAAVATAALSALAAAAAPTASAAAAAALTAGEAAGAPGEALPEPSAELSAALSAEEVAFVALLQAAALGIFVIPLRRAGVATAAAARAHAAHDDAFLAQAGFKKVRRRRPLGSCSCANGTCSLIRVRRRPGPAYAHTVFQDAHTQDPLVHVCQSRIIVLLRTTTHTLVEMRTPGLNTPFLCTRARACIQGTRDEVSPRA